MGRSPVPDIPVQVPNIPEDTTPKDVSPSEEEEVPQSEDPTHTTQDANPEVYLSEVVCDDVVVEVINDAASHTDE